MKLGSQIKKYRADMELSQDALAEKVFVSRQSISNWENDKTYPDIKSLLLLSEVFSVSLDTLIKGDVEKMKKEIDVQEYAKFNKDSVIFAVLCIVMLLLPAPLVRLGKWWGIPIYVALSATCMYYAIRIEKYKKKNNIQTYKEIVAFIEGKDLDEIEEAREEGKRPYQKIFLAVGSAVLMLVIALLLTELFK